MNKPIYTGKLRNLLAAMAISVVGACSSAPDGAVIRNADKPVGVKLSSPVTGRQGALNLSGQVEAGQSATISTRIMGYITMLRVKAGDRVTQGQLLVSISNEDILAKRAQADAAISEAQAALNSAQKDFDRFGNLYKQESASAKEFDNVSLQLASAKSHLEAARQMRNEITASLRYTTLRAPFSGIVTQKLADAGSLASPGMPILTIEKGGSYQVSASVPENVISRLRPGASVKVSISAINKVLTGKIREISQSSQFTGGQYIIKIGIPGDDKQGLFAGMYADVSVPLTGDVAGPSGNTVSVPVSAVNSKGQLKGLFTAGSNGKALLRWVRLGKVSGDQVEVLSGLAAGEQFIISSESPLYNGALIKINN